MEPPKVSTLLSSSSESPESSSSVDLQDAGPGMNVDANTSTSEADCHRHGDEHLQQLLEANTLVPPNQVDAAESEVNPGIDAAVVSVEAVPCDLAIESSYPTYKSQVTGVVASTAPPRLTSANRIEALSGTIPRAATKPTPAAAVSAGSEKDDGLGSSCGDSGCDGPHYKDQVNGPFQEANQAHLASPQPTACTTRMIGRGSEHKANDLPNYKSQGPPNNFMPAAAAMIQSSSAPAVAAAFRTPTRLLLKQQVREDAAACASLECLSTPPVSPTSQSTTSSESTAHDTSLISQEPSSESVEQRELRHELQAVPVYSAVLVSAEVVLDDAGASSQRTSSSSSSSSGSGDNVTAPTQTSDSHGAVITALSSRRRGEQPVSERRFWLTLIVTALILNSLLVGGAVVGGFCAAGKCGRSSSSNSSHAISGTTTNWADTAGSDRVGLDSNHGSSGTSIGASGTNEGEEGSSTLQPWSVQPTSPAPSFTQHPPLNITTDDLVPTVAPTTSMNTVAVQRPTSAPTTERHADVAATEPPLSNLFPPNESSPAPPTKAPTVALGMITTKAPTLPPFDAAIRLPSTRVPTAAPNISPTKAPAVSTGASRDSGGSGPSPTDPKGPSGVSWHIWIAILVAVEAAIVAGLFLHYRQWKRQTQRYILATTADSSKV